MEMATYIYSKVVRPTCDVTTFPTLLSSPSLGVAFMFPILLLEEIYTEDTQYVNGTESFKFHKLELLLLSRMLLNEEMGVKVKER